MDPIIWGPCIWNALFSISFNITKSDLPQMEKLLKCLEKIIPCPTCKAHYLINRQQADKLFPLKKSCENVQYWLWHVKSLINKNLKIPNTEFKYIKLRYQIFGHTICDTELLDILACMCLHNKKEEEIKRFHEFLFSLGTLLSKFLQGPMPSLLLCMDNVNPDNLINVVNSVRNNYNMTYRTITYYQPFLN
jgi:hypothetical protein